MAAAGNKKSGRDRKSVCRRHGSSFRKKLLLMFASCALTLLCIAGGTLAWLAAKTAPAVNTFTIGKIDGEIDEEFDGKTKKNVTVKNNGDIDAYVRINLVSYRADKDGNPVGGEASVGNITLGAGWVKHTDGYYYYTKPVKAGAYPETNLFDSYTLQEYEDGSVQVVEVMAELIQSEPAKAVQDAWGVAISDGTVADAPSGN